MTDFSAIDRRKVLLMGGGLAVVAAGGTPAFAQEAKPIKVAAIYTVPVDQQWVLLALNGHVRYVPGLSRIHRLRIHTGPVEAVRIEKQAST